MRYVRHGWCQVFALAAIAWTFSGCGDDALPPEPMFDNPAIVRVVNRLQGPVIYVHAKPCGTETWGEDLFRTDDPIAGTIQPGGSKDFTVEAGCYDLWARHMESTEPGPLIDKFTFNQAAFPATPVIWTLEADPRDPT